MLQKQEPFCSSLADTTASKLPEKLLDFLNFCISRRREKKEEKKIPMFPHNYYFGKIPNEAADPGVYFTLSLV